MYALAMLMGVSTNFSFLVRCEKSERIGEVHDGI
jgi:hypothetical protein